MLFGKANHRVDIKLQRRLLRGLPDRMHDALAATRLPPWTAPQTPYGTKSHISCNERVVLGLTSSRKLPCWKKLPRRPCTAAAAALRRLCGDGRLSSLPLLWLPAAWTCRVCDARASSAVAFERCSARWLHSMADDRGLLHHNVHSETQEWPDEPVLLACAVHLGF